MECFNIPGCNPQPADCNLECVKDREEIAEYTGLVRIVLVRTPRVKYWCRILWAGLIGLSYILIGATCTIVFLFMQANKLPAAENVHVGLCTIGFQLLIPLGILMLSGLNGPSAPMTVNHRKCGHVLIQTIGILCSIVGTFAVLMLGKVQSVSIFTLHFFVGTLSCIMALVGIVFGPLMLCLEKDNCCGECLQTVHKSAGILCLLLSSLCFITGLKKLSFKQWLPVPNWFLWITALCVIYTLIIFTVPFIRCLYDK